MINEYFVKIEMYHNGRSLGTKCFILDAESGKEAVNLVQEQVQKKRDSIFLKPPEIPDDFELLDIHKL